MPRFGRSSLAAPPPTDPSFRRFCGQHGGAAERTWSKEAKDYHERRGGGRRTAKVNTRRLVVQQRGRLLRVKNSKHNTLAGATHTTAAICLGLNSAPSAPRSFTSMDSIHWKTSTTAGDAVPIAFLAVPRRTGRRTHLLNDRGTVNIRGISAPPQRQPAARHAKNTEHSEAGLGCPAHAIMRSRIHRRHGGGVNLNISALALLLASRACIGRTTADPSLHQAEHATPATASASTAVAPRDAVQGSSSRAAIEAGVFDFSFGQLRPETPVPDMVQSHHDGEQVQQQLLSPPPSALSLRECSLGDAGVAEVATSPWVCGATAVRSLSLRQNQVR